MKLDAIDMKILNALFENSRYPFTVLAKKARTSRENCMYRFSRMKKLGLIKSTNAVINTNMLGYKQYAFFIQYSTITKNKEEELIRYIKNNLKSSWIGVIAGKWSIVFDIYASNDIDLQGQLKSLLYAFGPYIKKYAILSISNKDYMYNNAFNTIPAISTKKISDKKIKLDDIDMKIIRCLNQDARMSYAEMSKKINLTANAIRKRIKSLESTNSNSYSFI